MSLIDSVRSRVATWIAPQTRAMPQEVADALSTQSSSGTPVTEKTILSASAVFAALRMISETVAQLDWDVYETVDGTEKRNPSHPLQSLLNDEPNPEMTAFIWRQCMLASYYLWGNMIAEIVRVGGRPVELWPLHPSRVKPFRRPSGDLAYEIRDEDGLNPRTLDADDVYHVPLMSTDGVTGKGFIQRAKDSVGLTLGIEEYSGSSFKNGARPGGLLTHPGRLQPAARKNIRDEWDAMHRGADKAGRIAVLQEGMNFTPMQMNATDSQLIEQRTFQISEIARWFSIPPHLLRDLSRATFGNIEHQGIEYRQFTIQPIATAMQQEARRKLIARAERNRYSTFLDLDPLSRGDLASRYNAYAIARQNGWLNADEIREQEGLNPIGGDAGTTYMVNGNMITADSVVAKPVESSGTSSTSEMNASDAIRESQIKLAFSDILAGIIQRMLTKEANAAKRAAGKPKEFLSWVDQFYAEHRETLIDAIGPTVRAYVIATKDDVSAASIVDQHIAESRTVLIEASGTATADELPAKIETTVDRWDHRRATAFAREVIK